MLLFKSLIFSSHPLFICLLLVTLSFLTAILFNFMFSKWMFYVITLVFLGGIIIIFIYVASLRRNEKIFLNKFPLSSIFNLTLLSLFFWKLNFTQTFLFMSQLYINSNRTLLILLFSYLIYILFISVKITSSFKGTFIKLFN